MTHYEMKMVRSHEDGEGIALYRKEAGLRGIDALKLIHVYPPQEQYPLANGRYINDASDLFLDIIDILDGNADDYCAADTADAGMPAVLRMPGHCGTRLKSMSWRVLLRLKRSR